MRKDFLQKGETLLIWNDGEDHSSISYDSDLHDIKNVFAFVENGAMKVFRVDGDFKFEDVTEDVASAWLEEHGENPEDMNLDGYGDWLEQSAALYDFKDEYESQSSLYDQHSTLNHSQQGI